jgi:hypothetical protein
MRAALRGRSCSSPGRTAKSAAALDGVRSGPLEDDVEQIDERADERADPEQFEGDHDRDHKDD